MFHDDSAWNRDRCLERTVAKLLGYRNFRLSNATGIIWADRLCVPSDSKYIIESGMVCDPLPQWSTDLGAAWWLHESRPQGTILFSMAWLDLPPQQVARLICKAFIRWHMRKNIDHAQLPYNPTYRY